LQVHSVNGLTSPSFNATCIHAWLAGEVANHTNAWSATCPSRAPKRGSRTMTIRSACTFFPACGIESEFHLRQRQRVVSIGAVPSVIVGAYHWVRSIVIVTIV